MYFDPTNDSKNSKYLNIDFMKSSITEFTFNCKTKITSPSTWIFIQSLNFIENCGGGFLYDNGTLFINIFSSIDGSNIILENMGISIYTDTVYDYTITLKNNVYKYYFNGNLIYSHNSYTTKSLSMARGVYNQYSAYEIIAGDIFFADECLIDKNFTPSSTQLFMNELGPGIVLESNNKLYGMK